jgi:hypothetical protein
MLSKCSLIEMMVDRGVWRGGVCVCLCRTIRGPQCGEALEEEEGHPKALRHHLLIDAEKWDLKIHYYYYYYYFAKN